jgi:hypothetical protein
MKYIKFKAKIILRTNQHQTRSSIMIVIKYILPRGKYARRLIILIISQNRSLLVTEV